MARRDDPDPLLLQTVSRRLARLLAEPGAGEEQVGEVGGAPRPVRSAGAALARSDAPGSGVPGSAAEEVDEVPAPRRFGRRHVVVVCLLLVLGLGWAGWTSVRSRPVAITAPVAVTAGPASAASSATSSSSAAAPPGGPAPAATAPASGGASGSPTLAAAVVVHVLGAVRRPGLVELTPPARVQDAVDAADGFRDDADAGDLNLAQLLADGQQVVIGTRREPDGEVRGGAGGGSAGGSGSAGAAGTATGGSAAAGGAGGSEGVVDLNAASQAELEELPGVGPVTATAILAWRQEHGRFSRAEELQEVDGIGPKTFAQLAPHVRV